MPLRRPPARAVLFWTKLVGGMFVVLMLMVWEHVEAMHLERVLKGMQKEEDQLIFQNARMQSQINQWISPSHLDSVARKEFGMLPLDPRHRYGVQLP